MIIRSKKGTNEKFAIQNELQNLKNFYRKIKDSLRDTYQNWKNRYGRSYQGKDVTRSTMFWTAQKQFFPETLGKIYTYPSCFVRFILLANYKDSSSKTADSIEQYHNYWEELVEDPDFRYAMGKASPYALKDSDGFQYALSQDVHSIVIKIRVKDLDKFFAQDDGEDDKAVISLLEHELTHMYDSYRGRIKNYISSGVTSKELNNLSNEKDKNTFWAYNHVLYMIWNETEFNAYQLTVTSDAYLDEPDSSGNPVKIGDNIRTFMGKLVDEFVSNDSEELWAFIINYTQMGAAESSPLYKKAKACVNDPMRFREWFVSETQKKIESMVERAQKNRYLSDEQEKADIALADKIEEQLRAANFSPKKRSCVLNVTINHYFQKLSYAYPVKLTFKWSNVVPKKWERPAEEFNNNSTLSIEISKLHYQSPVIALKYLVKDSENECFLMALTQGVREFIVLIASFINRKLDSIKFDKNALSLHRAHLIANERRKSMTHHTLKNRYSKRRCESSSDFMQDSDGIMQDSPSRIIARKLRDLRDVDTVSLKDGGSTVYAHMDMNGEELYFETRQDYVMAYVKIPVSGKVCRTEEDVDEVVSDVMDFLSKV